MGRIRFSVILTLAALAQSSASPLEAGSQKANDHNTAKSIAIRRVTAPPVMPIVGREIGRDSATKTDTVGVRTDPSPWYDLTAQSLMALFAFAQVVLTGVGIHYIRKTLRETEKAVAEAGKGNTAAQAVVAESVKTTAEMVRANQIAEESLKTNARISSAGIIAWVVPFDMKWSLELSDPYVEIHYTNIGPTPAFRVEIHSNVVSFQQIPGTPRMHYKNRLPRWADLPDPSVAILSANSAHISRTPIQGLRGDLLTALKGGHAIMFAWGRIKYSDVVGEWHETQYCYLVDQEVLKAGQVFGMSPFGNDMNSLGPVI